MSFDIREIFFCDNCGVEEPALDGNKTPPEGWTRDYDDGDAIFGDVCVECVEEFKENATDG